jgi:hypothetical protein
MKRICGVMLVGGATATVFDTCLLCGSQLPPNQADQPDRRPSQGFDFAGTFFG